MKQRKIFFPSVLLAVIMCVSGLAGSARGETIRIGGTGFGLGVMKILARSFEESHPGEKIQVIPSLGSSGGIKALLHGALDIAISGRPLKAEESGKGIEADLFIRSPFIFIVNESVTKQGITIQELEKIFRGEMLTWPDGERIRPILRPEADTATKIVRGISSGMDQAMTLAMARKGMILEITDQDSARMVEKTPGALAASSLTQVYSEKRQVGILALNGIRPSVEALSDGAYPLSIPLYLVTPDRMKETALAFSRFLYTEKGRRILAENGNLIVDPERRDDQ